MQKNASYHEHAQSFLFLNLLIGGFWLSQGILHVLARDPLAKWSFLLGIIAWIGTYLTWKVHQWLAVGTGVAIVAYTFIVVSTSQADIGRLTDLTPVLVNSVWFFIIIKHLLAESGSTTVNRG